jgi:hypothetical protein
MSKIRRTHRRPSVANVLMLLAATASAAHAAVAPPPLQPADGDTYDVWVAGQEQYDSNLYRLPPGSNAATQVAPNASLSDEISTASLGGDGQWEKGKQVVELNLRADENLFARNTQLNNTSGYANLLWNWQVGSRFSGDAAVEYNHALASFAESLYLGRDLTDTFQYYADARYQLTPSWALFGGVNDLNVTHSLAVAQYNDFHQKSGDAGIELAMGIEDTLRLEYRYTDADFPPNRVLDLGDISFTPDYRENLTELLFNFGLTDKTKIDGYVGYRTRRFTLTSVDGFSKPVGRLELNWAPTEKTDLIFAGWHEVHSYLLSETDYFVSNGGSVAPAWNATEKIKLSVLASYEHQSFIGESATVLLTGPLTAKITTEQASMIYSPRDSWIFNLAVNHQKRAANQLFYQFDDQLVTGSVLFKFH